MTIYTIEVKGELSELFVARFEGESLRAGDGKAAPVGDIADQAQLRGLLCRITDLGPVLLSVTQADPNPPAQAERGTTRGGTRSMNADEIAKLAALRVAGTITPAEFDAAKGKALA